MIASFCHAIRGWLTLLRTQPNARIHAFATVAVVTVGLICRISVNEWLALIFAISLGWITEAINTALAFLADEVAIEWREHLKHVKDMAAFAVLVAAGASLIVGCIIFLPRLV